MGDCLSILPALGIEACHQQDVRVKLVAANGCTIKTHGLKTLQFSPTIDVKSSSVTWRWAWMNSPLHTDKWFTSHVYVTLSASPLTKAYTGPYLILHSGEKAYQVSIQCQNDQVSILPPQASYLFKEAKSNILIRSQISHL
ncbi:hypothetical protein SK128_012812 [Halocaridina rubra]|uniref:Uncharacterized protein n=1 Tax=Halocaridina rubra TaxID=373956 RepID=A0AAN8WZ65_HALRR